MGSETLSFLICDGCGYRIQGRPGQWVVDIRIEQAFKPAHKWRSCLHRENGKARLADYCHECALSHSPTEPAPSVEIGEKGEAR